MKGIKCSKITNGELVYLEGYAWKTGKETVDKFQEQKAFDTGYQEGNICLDLLGNNGVDILDTITITKERFDGLRPSE